MTLSPRTLEFINNLIDERDVPLSTGQTIEQLKEQAEGLSQDQASRWIDRLKTFPKERRSQPAPNGNGHEPEAGMYKLANGTIVRVYLGQRSGRMLAKKLVQDGGERPDDDYMGNGPPEPTGSYSYEYMGAASRFISDGTAKLSLEEAKRFGRMTGTCCVCARRLDVPESVEAGIGPVCGGRLEVG